MAGEWQENGRRVEGEWKENGRRMEDRRSGMRMMGLTLAVTSAPCATSTATAEACPARAAR